MSYFNSEQVDHMRSLSKISPDKLCYCGWYELGDCPHCGDKLTAFDKMKLRCPECGNSPSYGESNTTHIKGCSKSQ